MKEYKDINDRSLHGGITLLDRLFSRYVQNTPNIDSHNELVLKTIKQGGVAMQEYHNNEHIPESIKAEYDAYGEYFTNRLLCNVVEGNYFSNESVVRFSLINLYNNVKN